MRNFYLISLGLSSLIVLTGIFSAAQPPAFTAAFLAAALVSAYFWGLEKAAANIAPAYIDSETQETCETDEISILLSCPSEGSFHRQISRLSYMLLLGRNASESSTRINFAIKHLFETIGEHIAVYFSLDAGDLRFNAGIKPGKRGVPTEISGNDPIVEEIQSKIRNLTDARSLLRTDFRSSRPLIIEKEASGPMTVFTSISFYGKTSGILALTGVDANGFSNDQVKIIAAFATLLGLICDENRVLAEEQKSTAEDLSRRLCFDLLSQLRKTSMPIFPGWDFGYANESSREYGGDFFDLLPLPGNRLLAIAGTCSGAGLDAVLYLLRLKAMVKCLVLQIKSPAELLNQLSLLLGGDSEEELFATMMAVMLKSNSHEVQIADAGHALPMIFRTRNGFVELPALDNGIPLGLFKNAAESYQNQLIQMLPGDGLLIYTDGVLENRQKDGNRLTVEKVKMILEKFPEISAAQTAGNLFDELKLGNGAGHDTAQDQTVLYLKVE